MTSFVLSPRLALSRGTLIGVAALSGVVALWSAFALSTRAIEGAGLTTGDAAILRFTVPALLLTPWIPRTLRALRGAGAGALGLVLLAGLPHFLLFAWGAELTSAGLTGLLVPGTVPLFVTLLLFLRHRTPVSRRRLGALAAIVLGVAASAMLRGGAADLGGVVVLLAAGLVWALYTVGLASLRLDLVSVIVVISITSAIVALALAVTGVLPSHLLAGTLPAPQIATYALVQGVGTGLLSTACYVLAVKHLGSSLASSAGALSPVLTAVVAVPLLNEPLTAGLAIALALIVSGVALFHLAPRR
ncbi:MULTISPECIES: DMT family transporter [Microbacterium]|uniref:DMT family transporter n=1 Tax=Microbacterium TaxID=33882 RepID=UPI0027856024|nr:MULTISPECIES: DMT family transporter [Microbacterium]MDQ1076179.1 drug/metabolite transporter (DMT)-like permease [Microbacterium sp. SORGH_AS_0969]MDQ1116418.1 drug/metabolite transporter (DMT)-like permease [Microbacterium testaceum]